MQGRQNHSCPPKDHAVLSPSASAVLRELPQGEQPAGGQGGSDKEDRVAEILAKLD